MIIKAYTKQILELPVIPNVNIKRIHEFYGTLMYAVQSLKAMGGLEQVNGNVALTLEKLLEIRGDLTEPTGIGKVCQIGRSSTPLDAKKSNRTVE